MANPKPFVQVACICEKVLVEPDKVASLIRVVDTYFIELPKDPLPSNCAAVLDLTVFVSLKSGDVTGEHKIGLRLVSPDNKSQPAKEWPAEFLGGEAGVSLKVAFSMGKVTFGLYWFDVLWEGEVLTRIPFRLKAKDSESTDALVAPIETTIG